MITGRAQALGMTLLPGAPELLAAHASELPQRDDLCGAFCGALALRAAGVSAADGQPIDQDAVAVAAGSLVARPRDPGSLPAGESGRRDYRLELPMIDDVDRSGTTAAGVVQAISVLAGGALQPIPLSGPWTERALDGVFELAAACEGPVTLLANLATHHLWGGRPDAVQLLGHLLEGSQEGPPPDWSVGHFVCVFARVDGPSGNLYAVADTYPALGAGGVHLQPRERLAAAVRRSDKPAGGIIAVLAAEEADRFRRGTGELGLDEGLWDNGTPERTPS